MTSTSGKILNLAPLGMSTALMASNLKMSKKKKLTTGDFIKQGVKNIVGAKMIGMTANAAAGV